MLADNTFLVILFILFIFTTFTQLVYYLLFYLAVPAHKHPENDEKGISVSVIICARNEAENLKKFLPSVLEQKYPDYEVIVVNDCSEDNSDEILGE
jgi:cellulose synthase/poly-beta-1,6-N-acetylglucosamine synthase-like glycosyltransferase